MNPLKCHLKKTCFALSVLAATLLGLPARAQFVSTVTTNSLNQPAGVTIGLTNNLVYITDTGNYRIAQFDPSSGLVTTLAGSGTPGTNLGIGLAASFSLPQGIVTARGGLVVCDEGSQLIRYVTFDGVVTPLAGQPYITGLGNGPAASATFSYPTGIAADSAGDLFIADSQNGVIREIDTNDNVTTVATGGFSFDLPTAVAIDPYNNIWVADSGQSIICVISNGAVTVVAGAAGQEGTNDS